MPDGWKIKDSGSKKGRWFAWREGSDGKVEKVQDNKWGKDSEVSTPHLLFSRPLLVSHCHDTTVPLNFTLLQGGDSDGSR